MTLLIKILALLGVLLLAVLLLLMWIIFVPRHFWVDWCKQDGPTVKMNIGPFKVGLYPLPAFLQKKIESVPVSEETEIQTDVELTQKKNKNRPEEKQSAKPSSQEKDIPQDTIKFNSPDDIQLSMQLVKDVVSSARGIMARVLKAIKLRDVSFTVPVHSRDVYRTQKMYGAVTNSFYGLATFLQKHMHITFKSPIFVADFAGTYADSTYFYCQISASPVLLLVAGWYARTQIKTITIKHRKAPDAIKKENDNG